MPKGEERESHEEDRSAAQARVFWVVPDDSPAKMWFPPQKTTPPVPEGDEIEGSDHKVWAPGSNRAQSWEEVR